MANFFGPIRQTIIWLPRRSDKHKRKSGRQYTCLSDCHCCYLQFVGLSLVFVGFSFINVCRIVQFAGFFCMKIRQIDRNYTCHPSNTFNFSWMLSYILTLLLTNTGVVVLQKNHLSKIFYEVCMTIAIFDKV